MNKKALKTLEYEKVVTMLESKASFSLSKQLCRELIPTANLQEVNTRLSETSDAVQMILKRGSLPIGGIRDISESLKRTVVLATLSKEELIDVADFLYVSRKIATYRRNDKDNFDYKYIMPILDVIESCLPLEKEIEKCISRNFEVLDTASSELYNIRKQVKSAHAKIKEQLNNIINSSTYRTMLQDNVITIRNDRYCVPVKFEYKSSFKGMVHDTSSTGQTVFIEPSSVVDLNNKIKDLASAEKIEIDKILKRLTEAVAEQQVLLTTNLENIKNLDFIFAKGELALELEATQPIMNNKGEINIKGGRHPLLERSSVVPTDIWLGKDFTTLLITGPNTGGKTVALKTLGLFSLMAMSGLFVPCKDQSELSTFDNVFSDIGDEQSIEQSLSTFSSHMTNIVSILKEVTPRSLVLFDELGAGTDPTEGAALAISIISHLKEMNTRVLLTTHYAELKVYALSTEGVENASCEFDVATLRPTYKLLIGVPGKSNAFAISKRIGLPDFIIDKAKEHVSELDERFEDVITDLEINKKTVLIEKENAQKYKEEAENLKQELIVQKEKLEKQKENLIRSSKEEAKKIIQEAKLQADTLIAELNKQNIAKANVKEMEKTRDKIRKTLKNYESSSSANSKTASNKSVPKNLKVGDYVLVHSIDSVGTCLSEIDKNKMVMVQVGKMKMKFPLSDLSLEKQPKKQDNARQYAQSIKQGKSLKMSPNLDLRGLLVVEAIEKLDKYLDDATLSSLTQVTIIHGKGTGALRAAVTEHLKYSGHVKKYRLGNYTEGDDGVTIVELK